MCEICHATDNNNFFARKTFTNIFPRRCPDHVQLLFVAGAAEAAEAAAGVTAAVDVGADLPRPTSYRIRWRLSTLPLPLPLRAEDP